MAQNTGFNSPILGLFKKSDPKRKISVTSVTSVTETLKNKLNGT